MGELFAHRVETVFHLVAGYGVVFHLDVFDKVIRHFKDAAFRPAVGAVAYVHHIVSALQLVALEAVFVGVGIVVRGHVGGGEREGESLAFARFEQFGLCERTQLYVRLCDAALGVGRAVIELNGVLARHAARVGDLHLHGYLTVRVERAALCALGKLPCEVGVREAVAEGIHDVGFIPVVPLLGIELGLLLCVGRELAVIVYCLVRAVGKVVESVGSFARPRRVALGISARLPVAVARIYALFIVDIVAVIAASAVAASAVHVVVGVLVALGI